MYLNIVCLINPLNTELNPICNLLSLLEAHHILHVSKVRVKETEDGRESMHGVNNANKSNTQKHVNIHRTGTIQ